MEQVDDNVSVEQLAERMMKSRAGLASSQLVSFWGGFFMLGAALGNCGLLLEDLIRHDFPAEVGQWLMLFGLLCNAIAAFLVYSQAKSMIRKLDVWLGIVDDLRRFDVLISSGATIATHYVMKTKMTISTEGREEP